MIQSQPIHQILRHGEDIPQHVNLEFIKGFIDRCLEQGLELMQAILNLKFGFWVLNIAICVCIGYCRRVLILAKSEAFRRCGQQAGLETRDSLVDEVIYRIDDVVDQRLSVDCELISGL